MDTKVKTRKNTNVTISPLMNISQKYFNTREQSFFRTCKGLTEENLGTYSEMSAISLSIPPQGGSIAEPSPAHNVPILPANDLAGYSASIAQEDAVQKSLLPINKSERTGANMDVSRSKNLR